MTKHCTVCGKFQKKDTEMTMVEGKMMCPVCYAKYLAENKSKKTPEVESGVYGVTNHQMIPFINENIDNKEAIVKAHSDYPEVFENSLRYVKKNIRAQVTEYIGEVVLTDEKVVLINYLKPSRKGITRHQIINGINDSIKKNDVKMLSMIAKNFKQLVETSLRYINKSNREMMMKVMNGSSSESKMNVQA